MLVLLAVLAGSTASGPAAAGPPDADAVEVERATLRMGTLLRIRVAAPDREAGIEAIEEAFAAVERQESLLSSWTEASEIGRLNRAPVGAPFETSPSVAALLREVRGWARATHGAFEPVVGALIEAWDLRGSGRRPDPVEVRDALAATGSDALELRAGSAVAIRKHPSAWIDAGAFGKGAALRAAASSLREAGVRSALLDFGGQVLALGPAEDGRDESDGGSEGRDGMRGHGGTRDADGVHDENGMGDAGAGWPVSVAHPVRRHRPVARLRLRDASAATSGASERGATIEGRATSHVVDPRTGRPVEPWGSVTVVAPDPLVADVLATALYVMGPEEGLEWAADRRDVGALFAVLDEKDGLRFRWNGAMERWLEAEPASPSADGAGRRP